GELVVASVGIGLRTVVDEVGVELNGIDRPGTAERESVACGLVVTRLVLGVRVQPRNLHRTYAKTVNLNDVAAQPVRAVMAPVAVERTDAGRQLRTALPPCPGGNHLDARNVEGHARVPRESVLKVNPSRLVRGGRHADGHLGIRIVRRAHGELYTAAHTGLQVERIIRRFNRVVLLVHDVGLDPSRDVRT